MKNLQISRRDFLKLSASGVLGLALSELGIDRALAAPPASQGRITWSGVPLYDAPSFKAKEIRLFGNDLVVNLQAEVEGDEGNPFNKAWYQVDEGYTYSGWLQPVETKFQKPIYEIPVEGQLGEISVPVSETRISPYTYAKNGYRLYYESTHWVKKVIVTREEKSIWYEIFDSEIDKTFFVPYYNMRLIPAEELSLLSPEIPESEKLIHVDLSTQLATAFEGNTMVFSSRCSSGSKGTRTPTGEFLTYHKGPSVHMNNQDEDTKNHYDLPGVPWCTFFTGYGNAFHGTYWHNDYGRPRSHGCVNLPSADAKWIYRWSRPNVPVGEDYVHLPGEGTRVQIV
jgi:lipoprotein-anchoring transpeptidase ErfK/SrfK